MVRLDKIRSDLEQQLQIDKALRYVEVRADTIEEALSDAAVQLNSNVANLEYEIIEKGYVGFLGIAKQPWFIRVYENAEAVKKTRKTSEKSIDFVDNVDHSIEPADKDGEFFVRYFGSDIMLKIVLPVGEGNPVSLQEVLGKLHRSDTVSLEEPLIKKYVSNGTGGVYEPVGLYQHNAAADASFVVDISSDEMQATIIATAPSIGGSEITSELISRALETQGVVAGIDIQKIDDFIDNPVYGIPYVVAEAIKPIDGKDAYIKYYFETDRSKLRMQETSTGQVNFKELNLIQNVLERQPLAQKIPAERGSHGQTLLGRFLEAKNGKDINLPLGNNVVMDEDGRTILAAKNGQVLLIGGKINVEPVMELDEVSIKTGNIKYVGTVIVKKGVEDGYSIEADGDIEVHGSVGSCNLKAGGNIIVQSGIMGRDIGVIEAGKSLYAKFIENASSVNVNDYVIVQDGIVNSNVTAKKRILLQGKRAQILGGHLFATEEISAKTVGSSGGNETILEVGLDPQLKQRMTELVSTKETLGRELEAINLDIQTLDNYLKARRALSKDKQDLLTEKCNRRDEITEEIKNSEEELQDIQTRLHELKTIGKVSVSGTVYAGTKILVRDVKDEVRADVKSVTFFYENGFVRRGKYEAPDTSITKQVLDGYSSD